MDGAASVCYTDGSIALGGKTVLKSTPGFWQAMDTLRDKNHLENQLKIHAC